MTRLRRVGNAILSEGACAPGHELVVPSKPPSTLGEKSSVGITTRRHRCVTQSFMPPLRAVASLRGWETLWLWRVVILAYFNECPFPRLQERRRFSHLFFIPHWLPLLPRRKVSRLLPRPRWPAAPPRDRL